MEGPVILELLFLGADSTPATSGPTHALRTGPAPPGHSPGCGFPQPSPKGLKIVSAWRPAPGRAAEVPGRGRRRPRLAAGPSRCSCLWEAGAAAHDRAALRGSGLAPPGAGSPPPPSPAAAAPPVRPSRREQEEGHGDGSRSGGFGRGPRPRQAAPHDGAPGSRRQLQRQGRPGSG